MNYLETLREELYQRKVAFDRELSRQPSLERAQRLARWETFLAELQPLSMKLAKAERDAAYWLLAQHKVAVGLYGQAGVL